ncbi:hypothetical protein CGLO_06009 [Colletotrichum gloeosporioides Cg-14]|uniref:Uncharacterized protein n=1 Tax=Colletotrichum gloeosporioides (strain Cg-14) TaxID=1237896 RepID=T0KQ80_COLGC|nr:hypothetical protein CGLO_06009 [Colletotrichum gloeosporioides Cg-14]
MWARNPKGRLESPVSPQPLPRPPSHTEMVETCASYRPHVSGTLSGTLSGTFPHSLKYSS